MGMPFNMTPRDVAPVGTKFRCIQTQLPHPEAVETIRRIQQNEPRASESQPPLLWDRAEDVGVFDRFGNKWLDFTSGVLVANSGHAAPEVKQAIVDTAQHGNLHSFAFYNEQRGELTKYLADLSPDGLDKMFLLSSGAEAIEFAVKCCRSHGIKFGGDKKLAIVGFDRGFHGRTLGAQQVGGIPGQKDWIVLRDPAIFNAPFPDGYWQEDVEFETFTEKIRNHGLKPESIAGVVMESFQGGGPDFAPVEYVKRLRRWCDRYGVLLVFDEIQAGCGRSGKFWAFEHYDVKPDLIAFGKGVSSSLPMSGVIGRPDVLDIFDHGSLVSTHSGNPICSAAALANLKKIKNEKLTENAANLGVVLTERLEAIQSKHSARIGRVSSRGLVGGLQTVLAGKKEPDPELAHRIVELCFERGLLFFAPAGAWGQTIKLCPPLTITEEALIEGMDVFASAVDDAIAEQ
ncbi:MAG: aspartate aminotransferase family protein [Verrucomicrobiales bacterium]|nr:aspartate aminotransferase family protein [Verrucomicrobiales bacterium]|tara:strand:- start:6286 stop:7659 length:1374 start_codon:yes stop_codon:yes gene_type:complete